MFSVSAVFTKEMMMMMMMMSDKVKINENTETTRLAGKNVSETMA